VHQSKCDELHSKYETCEQKYNEQREQLIRQTMTLEQAQTRVTTLETELKSTKSQLDSLIQLRTNARTDLSPAQFTALAREKQLEVYITFLYTYFPHLYRYNII
jgi:chromosome segregation ATPase